MRVPSELVNLQAELGTVDGVARLRGKGCVKDLYLAGYLPADAVRDLGWEGDLPKRAPVQDFDIIRKVGESCGYLPWMSKLKPDYSSGEFTFERSVFNMELLEEYGFVDMGYPWLFGRTIQPVVLTGRGNPQISEPFVVAIPKMDFSMFTTCFDTVPGAAGGFAYRGVFTMYNISYEFSQLVGLPSGVRKIAVCTRSYPDKTSAPMDLELPDLKLKIMTPFLR